MGAASSIARKVAGFSAQSAAPSRLVGLAITGNCITITLACVPWYTFVRTAMKEKSVGDRMVHAYLIPFINAEMWALYASKSLPCKTFFLIANIVGGIFQVIYTTVYICFTDSRKRKRAIFHCAAFGAIAFIMFSLRFAHHHWDDTLIDVMAMVSGIVLHIFSAFDVAMVMKRGQINKMNLITPLISLFGASIWTAYGYLSAHVNYYVVVPNLTGVVLQALQLIGVCLILLYHKLGSYLQQWLQHISLEWGRSELGWAFSHMFSFSTPDGWQVWAGELEEVSPSSLV